METSFNCLGKPCIKNIIIILIITSTTNNNVPNYHPWRKVTNTTPSNTDNLHFHVIKHTSTLTIYTLPPKLNMENTYPQQISGGSPKKQTKQKRNTDTPLPYLVAVMVQILVALLSQGTAEYIQASCQSPRQWAQRSTLNLAIHDCGPRS